MQQTHTATYSRKMRKDAAAPAGRIMDKFNMRGTLAPTYPILFALALNVFGTTDALAVSDAMTAGDLQQICLGSSVESNAACRYYILGVAQGIDLGMLIAGGKTKGGRPCVPENISSSALEIAVKARMGEDLAVFPDDRRAYASGIVGAAIVVTFPCRKAN